MNPATAAIIVQGVAALAPYLAELGGLAAKARNGESVSETDLARAEAARRQAFTALRQKLLAPPAEKPPATGN